MANFIRKVKNIEVDSIKILDFPIYPSFPFYCNKPLDFLCVPQYMISRIIYIKNFRNYRKTKRVFLLKRSRKNHEFS